MLSLYPTKTRIDIYYVETSSCCRCHPAPPIGGSQAQRAPAQSWLVLRPMEVTKTSGPRSLLDCDISQQIKNAYWITMYTIYDHLAKLWNENDRFGLVTMTEHAQKFNFDQNPTFHEFFIPNFFDNFLVKLKLSTAKKIKTAAFSRVFSQNDSTNFLGKSKLNFWTKN